MVLAATERQSRPTQAARVSSLRHETALVGCLHRLAEQPKRVPVRGRRDSLSVVSRLMCLTPTASLGVWSRPRKRMITLAVPIGRYPGICARWSQERSPPRGAVGPYRYRRFQAGLCFQASPSGSHGRGPFGSHARRALTSWSRSASVVKTDIETRISLY